MIFFEIFEIFKKRDVSLKSSRLMDIEDLLTKDDTLKKLSELLNSQLSIVGVRFISVKILLDISVVS